MKAISLKRRRLALASAAGLLALSLALPARAALNCYLYLTAGGASIQGGVTQKGRENSIMVIAFSQEIQNPSEATAAKPKLGTIVFRKEVDKSSPLLARALFKNEPIEGTFKFWTPQIRAATGVGSEFQHYTIQGRQGRIVSIKTVMENNKNPELMKYAEYEDVTVRFDSLSWTWNEGGVTHEEKK